MIATCHVCGLTKLNLNWYRIRNKSQKITVMKGYQSLAWHFCLKRKLIYFITSMLKPSVLASEEAVVIKWWTLLHFSNGHLHALVKVWIIFNLFWCWSLLYALRQLLQLIGHRREDKREETFSYSRPETTCGCDARMKISLRDGFYYVYEFEASHNHTLANGLMAQYLRSQRKVTEAQIANAEVAKSVGISNKAIVDLMAKEAGGSENLGFRPQDMKNCLHSKRTIKRR